MTDPLQALAKQISSAPARTPALPVLPGGYGIGLVTAINSSTTIAMTYNGALGVPCNVVTTFIPSVGQTVLVAVNGTQLWAIGPTSAPYLPGSTPSWKANSITDYVPNNTVAQISIVSPAYTVGGTYLGDNYNCVVPVAGIYRISGVVLWSEIYGDNNVAITLIGVNASLTNDLAGNALIGEVQQSGIVLGSVPQSFGIGCSTSTELNANDTVSLWAYQNTGSTQTANDGAELCVEYVGPTS